MSANRSIHLTVHVHNNPAAIAERAAHILAEYCEEAIAERGVFNIALSGGATPVPFYRLLGGSDWAERLPWEKINIYFVDERSVNPESPESNYFMLRRELFSNISATHYFRIQAESDPVKAAEAYEARIRKDFNLRPGELPRFDFILLGMGKNGHTGSLSVGSPALFEKDHLVIDQYEPERKYDRVTMTLPVLNNARCCMFLVTGAEKHEVLTRALDLLAEPTLPAQMVRPTFGDLIWIVDEQAATGRMQN